MAHNVVWRSEGEEKVETRGGERRRTGDVFERLKAKRAQPRELEEAGDEGIVVVRSGAEREVEVAKEAEGGDEREEIALMELCEGEVEGGEGRMVAREGGERRAQDVLATAQGELGEMVRLWGEVLKGGIGEAEEAVEVQGEDGVEGGKEEGVGLVGDAQALEGEGRETREEGRSRERIQSNLTNAFAAWRRGSGRWRGREKEGREEKRSTEGEDSEAGGLDAEDVHVRVSDGVAAEEPEGLQPWEGGRGEEAGDGLVLGESDGVLEVEVAQAGRLREEGGERGVVHVGHAAHHTRRALVVVANLAHVDVQGTWARGREGEGEEGEGYEGGEGEDYLRDSGARGCGGSPTGRVPRRRWRRWRSGRGRGNGGG